MAINVSLVNFTDQGIRNIKDSPQRARAFRELCKQQGVQVREMLWTSGPYDMVVVTEGTEEALTAVLLDQEAFQRVLEKVS
ncbi:MAG: GYD domain-containing protein [Betaproteobacteria bacterium]|nr:MAG: GYD domain-containing protein [Betaproteobacteria bacterium]